MSLFLPYPLWPKCFTAKVTSSLLKLFIPRAFKSKLEKSPRTMLHCLLRAVYCWCQLLILNVDVDVDCWQLTVDCWLLTVDCWLLSIQNLSLSLGQSVSAANDTFASLENPGTRWALKDLLSFSNIHNLSNIPNPSNLENLPNIFPTCVPPRYRPGLPHSVFLSSLSLGPKVQHSLASLWHPKGGFQQNKNITLSTFCG